MRLVGRPGIAHDCWESRFWEVWFAAAAVLLGWGRGGHGGEEEGGCCGEEGWEVHLDGVFGWSFGFWFREGLVLHESPRKNCLILTDRPVASRETSKFI